MKLCMKFIRRNSTELYLKWISLQRNSTELSLKWISRRLSVYVSLDEDIVGDIPEFSPFVEKEIYAAILQMNNNKMRGPNRFLMDGFPAKFYRRHWG